MERDFSETASQLIGASRISESSLLFGIGFESFPPIMFSESALRKIVLLVDDHPLTRRVVSVLLRSIGYDVRTAGSGHAALHFLDICRPDAIVLDLLLPDISGIEVLKRLRDDAFLADTPILIFSGDRDDLARIEHSDAQACLAKGSVSWKTLADQVDQLTGGPSAGAALIP